MIYEQQSTKRRLVPVIPRPFNITQFNIDIVQLTLFCASRLDFGRVLSDL